MSDMKRREFISLLGGAAAAWPLAVSAQQAGKVWRMGFIAHGHESFYDALFEGLSEYGYEEGRNLIVERRYAQGQAERFKEFAAEMVRLNVDVIVVVTTPAALAVMNATKTIPIVHPNAIDPLNTGLIASLAHPGGNLTGGAQLTAEVSAKRLEILKKVVPGLSRGAALWNPANPALVWKETQGATRALGLTLQSHEVQGPKDFAAAFAKIAEERPDAPRRAPRLAGCGDDAAAKRDHRLRDTEAAAEHVSRERVGSGWRSNVLRGEPPFYVSARRILRGPDFQRRKAR
jgi:putative ABC transport system substrate-binding protein